MVESLFSKCVNKQMDNGNFRVTLRLKLDQSTYSDVMFGQVRQ